ncbi:expressed unknown protein [Seminavis robusta]|uniref:Uncharacterized protein n=1 Tax=Seminavis robusta TaxID=568900 RepID=A0A9N8DC34_9STRA|nr:expressed unknown protein [Seminavis robusta]|eukprot:Sro80_g042970.1 n/a (198) ;mRNA; f:29906-30676
MSIVELSNEAVFQLHNGNIDSATKILEQALKLIVADHSGTAAPMSVANRSCVGYEGQTVEVEAPSPDLVGAINLYHLALLNHAQGIQNGNSTGKLSYAKKLYHHALEFVKKHSQVFGSRRALLVSLAIANNLGELFWQELQDVVEAKKCYSLVRETLRYMEHLRSFQSERCSEMEYSFFATNTMIRMGTDMQTATAA